MIVFNDKPSNDWQCLTDTITTHRESLVSAGEKQRNVYTLMLPRNFYEQVMPDAPVDMGFCFSSLNHLDEQTPGAAADNPMQEPALGLPKSSHGPVSETARRGFMRFINHRAKEFRSGASLIINLAGRNSDSGIENLTPLRNAIGAALKEMRRADQLSDADLLAYKNAVSAMHTSSMVELQQWLQSDAVQANWTITNSYEKIIEHPAFKDLDEAKHAILQQRGGEIDKASASDDAELLDLSKSYVNTVVDWIMAALANYFLSALKVSRASAPAGSASLDETAEDLLEELRRTTVENFLRDSRDETVQCNCFFLSLTRK
jgi:hypothetical protein